MHGFTLILHTSTTFHAHTRTEKLADLVSLEFLDLRANSISSVKDLDELRTVSALCSVCI